jgi:acyl-homoserine lactone acylase PvdQ
MIGTADGETHFFLNGPRAPMTMPQPPDTDGLTLEQAANLAFSTEVYKAQAWQARIAKVAPGSEFARMLTGWSRRSDADSRPALAFYLFKMALGEAASAVEPPDSLSDNRIRAALRKAQDRLETEFPFQATYGTLFRVGRDGAARSYPVGGGSVAEAGMATPRAIEFEKRGNVMMGVGGQSATQIVQLSRPPKSYMVMPLGESDDPKSPHFDDQAAKLFSKARAASTYFGDRKELEKHVKERKELVAPL